MATAKKSAAKKAPAKKSAGKKAAKKSAKKSCGYDLLARVLNQCRARSRGPREAVNRSRIRPPGEKKADGKAAAASKLQKAGGNKAKANKS